MRHFLRITVLLALLSGVARPAAAQDDGEADLGDPRIRTLLESSGMVFSVDPDEDFRLIMEYESGRTQVVFVRSTTEAVKGIEIREIYSPAVVGDSTLTCDNMSLLLQLNQENTLGAWLIDQTSSGPAAIFCVRIPVDPEPEVFRHLIGLVGQTADGIEEALTGGDDY